MAIEFDIKELFKYEQSMNAYRDIRNGMDSAKKEGMKQGIEQGMKQGMKQGIELGKKQNSIDIARKLKEMGMSLEDIMRITGLGKEDASQA